MSRAFFKDNIRFFSIPLITLLAFISLFPHKTNGQTGNGHDHNGNGSCIVVIDNPFGGTVSVTIDLGGLSNEVQISDALILDVNDIIYGSNSDNRYAGFVEWDISTIWDDVTIDNVTLLYEGSQDDGVVGRITGLVSTPQPSLESDPSVIYSAISSDTTYVATFNPVVSTNQTESLGGFAASELESQLSSDWFAIGFFHNDSTIGFDGIYSEDYSTVDPEPSIRVSYQIPLSDTEDTDGDGQPNQFEIDNGSNPCDPISTSNASTSTTTSTISTSSSISSLPATGFGKPLFLEVSSGLLLLITGIVFIESQKNRDNPKK